MSTETGGGRQGAMSASDSTIRSGGYNLWGDLRNRIEGNQLIPVLSNSLMNNYIFDVDKDGRVGSKLRVLEEARADELQVTENDFLSIEEQVAETWAKHIGYPFAEKRVQLSRVAQYNLVKVCNNDPVTAKKHYLTFLKMYLLRIAKRDPVVQQNEDLAEWVDGTIESITGLDMIDTDYQLKFSFSDLVVKLGYPRFTDNQHTPLSLLAEMPLPVYITTSHHDFLERALRNKEKHPRVQVCCWNEDKTDTSPEWFDPSALPEEPPDLSSEFTPETPLVYHLYGLEKRPTSLVISEDDYIDFLIRVSVDEEIIPFTLRDNMTESSLLLLGYRIRNWDFRVLLKGIIRRLREYKTSNFAIQLDPGLRQTDKTNGAAQTGLSEARGYIEAAYFEPSKFIVEWKDTVHFVQEMHRRWKSPAKPPRKAGDSFFDE